MLECLLLAFAFDANVSDPFLGVGSEGSGEGT